MSFAPALVLREGDCERLGELARLPSVPSGLAKISVSLSRSLASRRPRTANVFTTVKKASRISTVAHHAATTASLLPFPRRAEPRSPEPRAASAKPLTCTDGFSAHAAANFICAGQSCGRDSRHAQVRRLVSEASNHGGQCRIATAPASPPAVGTQDG
jgi:hypothetical protein